MNAYEFMSENPILTTVLSLIISETVVRSSIALSNIGRPRVSVAKKEKSQ